jgi:hypothetical protein
MFYADGKLQYPVRVETLIRCSRGLFNKRSEVSKARYASRCSIFSRHAVQEGTQNSATF